MPEEEKRNATNMNVKVNSSGSLFPKAQEHKPALLSFLFVKDAAES